MSCYLLILSSFDLLFDLREENIFLNTSSIQVTPKINSRELICIDYYINHKINIV